jgi:hypothetical protein
LLEPPLVVLEPPPVVLERLFVALEPPPHPPSASRLNTSGRTPPVHATVRIDGKPMGPS